MIVAQTLGHPIYFDEEKDMWYYQDNGEEYSECAPRACALCGLYPTDEGFDPCLGYIPEAIAACCGHGFDEAYMIDKDGNRTEFYPII